MGTHPHFSQKKPPMNHRGNYPAQVKTQLPALNHIIVQFLFKLIANVAKPISYPERLLCRLIPSLPAASLLAGQAARRQALAINC